MAQVDPDTNANISSFFTNGPASGVLATAAFQTFIRLRKIENGREFKNIRNQRLPNHQSQRYFFFDLGQCPGIIFLRPSGGSGFSEKNELDRASLSWAEPARASPSWPEPAGPSRPEPARAGRSRPEEQSAGFSRDFQEK